MLLSVASRTQTLAAFKRIVSFRSAHASALLVVYVKGIAIVNREIKRCECPTQSTLPALEMMQVSTELSVVHAGKNASAVFCEINWHVCAPSESATALETRILESNHNALSAE